MRLIPIAERLAVELLISTCLNDLDLSRLRFEHPTLGLQGDRSNPLRHRRGVFDTCVKQLCSLYMLKHMYVTWVKHMFNICLTCKLFVCNGREAELTTTRREA